MNPLTAQLRECYGRIVYTHKTHEKNADIYLSWLYWIKVGQIVISTVATGAVLGSLFGPGKSLTFVAACVSALQLFLNAYLKNYDLGGMAQKHADTAAALWPLRESYLSLLTDAGSGKLVEEEIVKRRDSMQSKLASIYAGAPRTISRAYSRAQKALKVDEDLTFSDAEIDRFLPTPLKSTAKMSENPTANAPTS